MQEMVSIWLHEILVANWAPQRASKLSLVPFVGQRAPSSGILLWYQFHSFVCRTSISLICLPHRDNARKNPLAIEIDRW
jgi:hypothetical protein